MNQVSVIIPAFKPRDFHALERSMDANRAVEAEWIVVDDASGPDFVHIFDTLPKRTKLIRLPENRRQGGARNAGLAEARSPWIKFLDSDDILDDGHLAALLERTHEGTISQKAIPFAPTRHVFNDGRSTVNVSWRDLPEEPYAQYRRQLVRPFLHHCGALFPRNLLLRLKGYDERLVTDEDGDLLLRILHAGHHFMAVNNVNYHYVHHNDGLRVSADDDIAKMRARIRVCDKVEAAWGQGMPQEIRYKLAQRMDMIAMNYWQSFPQNSRELLYRARRLSPGYLPNMRGSLRLLRRIGGPNLVFVVQSIYRCFKGLPKGGAQG